MAQRLLAFVFLAAVMAACSAEVESLPTLAGVSSTTISIDDRVLVVAVADTPETRRRGLMNVTDLGALDGMLFVWQADSTSGFFMKDTLIPLDIGFFSAGGAVVDRLTMVPCTDDPCQTYRAAGAYRYALETAAGDLDFMTPESVLVLDRDS
jgi:uncharacterized membrane protein (UPF0127 family)